MLETRLDNIVFRLGLAPSRRAARQMVLHNHVRVNGRRVERPVALRDGDRIQVGPVTMTYRTLDRLPSTVTRGA